MVGRWLVEDQTEKSTLSFAPEIPQLKMIEVLVHTFNQNVGGYHRIDINN